MISNRTEQQDKSWEGYQYLRAKKFDLAEKSFLQALEAKDDNPIDRHFVFNWLIELYYRLRADRKDALEKCILFCLADIKALPEFLLQDKRQYRDETGYLAPSCPSVERLAIVLEKKGEFQEAIELCKYAIELGLDARWDSYNAYYAKNKGYKARIQKIEKKIASRKREGSKT